MTGHRERLMEMGLYTPLSSEEIAKRNGMLQRMKEKKENASGYPCFVVYRSDDPYRYASSLMNKEKRAHDAEKIAEKLYSWEASKLCFKLGSNDPDQPKRPIKETGYLSMYKYCTVYEWEEWQNEKRQISLIDGKDA